jgi:SAM-dependent methyltransferase
MTVSNFLIKTLYHSPLSILFPTSVKTLSRNLKDCKSVLDLGCGPTSPIQYIPWLTKTLGVEAYEPYITAAKKNGTHDEYLKEDIMSLDIAENSFDAVILIGVLEHIERDDGIKLLELCEKWASKKVILTTPNGFIPQKSLDGNPLQVHLSGWLVDEFRELGFFVRGMCGVKFLRQEVDADGMGEDLLVTMRFRPRFFWFIVSVLTVPLAYFFPKMSFDLFCVKRL